jgi:hypothetical protein
MCAFIWLLAHIAQNVSCQKIALVTLAFGPVARVHTSTLIQSFITNSAAPPDVSLYVVTDDVQAFLDAGVEFNQIIVTTPNFRQTKISKIMQIKMLKTRLFEFVPSSVTWILYLDADVILGLPIMHCCNALLYQFKQNATTSAVAFAEGRETERYHSGVMLLHRNSSTKLLATWATAINSSRFNRDQEALTFAVDSIQANVAIVPNVLEHPILSVMTGKFLREMRPACFVHYTLFRQTNPRKFGFTHAEGRFYFNQILRIDYLPDLAAKHRIVGVPTFYDTQK